MLDKTSIAKRIAQEIKNGFQIVDAVPKVVMVLLYTAAKDVYLVKGKSAIVFKANNQWLYSENVEGVATSKVLNIKF